VELADGIPLVLADRARIDQVLLNLVHNAIKFTPGGGSILIRSAAKDGVVEFQVRDSGVGVAPDELPRLFERFYKADRARRSQGTGLGLAIAKHIVQAHGGEIWAERNEPTGTAFVFQLPIQGPPEIERSNSEGEQLVAAVGGSA
jgi:two-component system phosphate regulon sensor histidine kinase PhoR